jgi:hypothetical protein
MSFVSLAVHLYYTSEDETTSVGRVAPARGPKNMFGTQRYKLQRGSSNAPHHVPSTLAHF